MSSPTQRSLKYMRDLGYHAEITERWIPGANLRKDLWSFCDVLCLHRETGEMVAVQTTSYTNIAARVNKIKDCELVPVVRKAGIAIHVHGWRKVGNRWQVKVKDLS